MINDFLKYHNIPHPDHIEEWIELEYVRILRFQGDINNNTLPKIFEWAHMPIYQGTMVVYHFFATLTGNIELASIAEKVAVEVADKTISLLLVAVAVIFIRDFLNWNRKALEK